MTDRDQELLAALKAAVVDLRDILAVPERMSTPTFNVLTEVTDSLDAAIASADASRAVSPEEDVVEIDGEDAILDLGIRYSDGELSDRDFVSKVVAAAAQYVSRKKQPRAVEPCDLCQNKACCGSCPCCPEQRPPRDAREYRRRTGASASRASVLRRQQEIEKHARALVNHWKDDELDGGYEAYNDIMRNLRTALASPDGAPGT